MDRKAGSFVCVTKSAASRNNSCHEKANERGNSLLCTAALLGHTFCVTILVDYRDADIEEVGSVSIQGLFVSGVTPLWCASNEGHSWIVEHLLCKGANPNGVTSFHSSPLRSACTNGHFFVVRLLVEHGADIEAANHQGINSLMFASVNGHLKIVKYLLDAGADVNREDLIGNSAVRASADAGHLAVAELLLDHKARMDADDSGLTPLISASALGHTELVERLLTRADLVSVKETADALELLGASIYNRTGDIFVAICYWKAAMSMRYVNGVLIYPKAEDSLSHPTHAELSEVVTFHQLENIALDHDAVQDQALLVMARVLGHGHLDTLRIIRRTGLDYATRLDFKRCNNLTIHAIDMQRNNLKLLDPNRLFHFKSFIIFFTHMTNAKHARGSIYKPKEYFEEFLLAFEKCIDETELIFCGLNCTGVYTERSRVCHLDQIIRVVLHLLVPFVRLQPDITDHQCHTFKRALRKIVKMEPRDYMGAALLHYSCSKDFKDIENFILPVSASNRAEVVDLLLETGADPSVTGRDGNTPLHQLAMNKECPKSVVDALLSGGAHLDAMNSQGQTFASLRASRGQPISQLVNVVRHTSLQCLAAASIRRHGVPYEDVLPSRLVKFVDMH